MFQPSVAIVICIFLQGTVSQASDVQDKVLEPLCTEKQCNGYCFSVLKPILDHFVSLKEGADTSNELRDTVKDLQSQLENTKTQLKDKENLISEKDQRIHELQVQLNFSTARFSEIGDQLNTSNELRDKIHSLEDTVKDLENTKTQLKDKENLISEKDQRIHELQVQLHFTTARFSMIGDQLNTSNELRDKIHSLEDTVKDLENTKTQLKDKENLISEKDQRIHELQDQLATCNQTDLNLPNTCPSGSPNGIYQIKLRGTTPFKVPCVSSKSGWTVVLRRIDGSENFNRTWNEYRDGFGDLRGEFFIGLEKLHLMTQSDRHELYIQLRDVNGSAAFASYDNFIVGSEEEDYELKSLGKYSGTAGDSLDIHSKQKFSTFDRDNDIGLRNCAVLFGGGGWWYRNCATSSLTGKYHKDQRPKGFGIFWAYWRGHDISLTFAEMMIRPITIEV